MFEIYENFDRATQTGVQARVPRIGSSQPERRSFLTLFRRASKTPSRKRRTRVGSTMRRLPPQCTRWP
jgi:hypothetical protein